MSTATVNGHALTSYEAGLFRSLIALGFDRRDYLIVGSGALKAYGLPRQIGDLDVVARGEVWQRAREEGDIVTGPISGDDMARLAEGRLEFAARWFKPVVAPKLFRSARWVDFCDEGQVHRIQVASRDDILTSKERLGRAKDVRDVAVFA